MVGSSGADDLTGAGSPLSKLTREMARPYPNQKAVISNAKDLQAALTKSARSVEGQQLTAEQIAGWLKGVSAVGTSASQQSWDGATQSWLSLTAIHQGLNDVSGSAGQPSEKSQQINASLEKIRNHLEFPKDFDSPKDFSSDPATEISAELKKIHDILE